MMFNIMQGDEYGIPFQVTTEDGIGTPDMFDDVEIMIDDVRKSLKKGEITFDENTQEFIFPLKQSDSFSFCNGFHTAQIRCKFKNGDVIGVPIGEITIHKSNSKEVL